MDILVEAESAFVPFWFSGQTHKKLKKKKTFFPKEHQTITKFK